MLQKWSARLVALDWRADDWIETLGLVLSFLSFNALILEAAIFPAFLIFQTSAPLSAKSSSRYSNSCTVAQPNYDSSASLMIFWLSTSKEIPWASSSLALAMLRLSKVLLNGWVGPLDNLHCCSLPIFLADVTVLHFRCYERGEIRLRFQQAGPKIFNLRIKSGEDRVLLNFKDRAKIRRNGNRGRGNVTLVSDENIGGLQKQVPREWKNVAPETYNKDKQQNIFW